MRPCARSTRRMRPLAPSRSVANKQGRLVVLGGQQVVKRPRRAIRRRRVSVCVCMASAVMWPGQVRSRPTGRAPRVSRWSCPPLAPARRPGRSRCSSAATKWQFSSAVHLAEGAAHVQLAVEQPAAPSGSQWDAAQSRSARCPARRRRPTTAPGREQAPAPRPPPAPPDQARTAPSWRWFRRFDELGRRRDLVDDAASGTAPLGAIASTVALVAPVRRARKSGQTVRLRRPALAHRHSRRLRPLDHACAASGSVPGQCPDQDRRCRPAVIPAPPPDTRYVALRQPWCLAGVGRPRSRCPRHPRRGPRVSRRASTGCPCGPRVHVAPTAAAGFGCQHPRTTTLAVLRMPARSRTERCLRLQPPRPLAPPSSAR